MKDYWKNVILLGSHFAWILSLPLWGPVLGRWAEMNSGDPFIWGIAFITGTVISLLVLPWWSYYRQNLVRLGFLGTLCVVGGSLLFFVSSSWVQPVIVLALGISSGLVILLWYYRIARDEQYDGWLAIAQAIFLANAILYVFGVASLYLPMWLLIGALALIMVYTAYLTSPQQSPVGFEVVLSQPRALSQSEKRQEVSVFVLMFLLYFAGSVTLDVVYSGFSGSLKTAPIFFNLIPYMAAIVLLAYLCAKHWSFFPLAASIFLGLTLIFRLIIRSPEIGYTLAMTFAMIAFAFLDLFLWSYLTRSVVKNNQEKMIRFGQGLAVNLCAVEFGVIFVRIVPTTELTTGIGLIFLLFAPIPLFIHLLKGLPSAERVKAVTNFDAANLTKRETEVLDLVVAGLANEEIAAALYISVPTVRSHLRQVYRKTGFHNRRELLAEMIKD